MRAFAAAVVLCLLATAAPADAADFYDSAYSIESAFLTLAPGETGVFSVSFINRGTVTWVKGTSTQVDLAACLANKVTCNARETALAAFDPGTWLRPGRYATHAQSEVPPGGTATFVYAVKAPTSQAAGTFRFNGDLVLGVTGTPLRQEGYYHELRVQGSSCGSPVGMTASPAFTEAQVGTTAALSFTVNCPDGSKAVGATVNAAVRAGTEVAGNPNLDMTATTDASGVATVRWTRSNPGRELVTASVAGAAASVTATSTVRWAVPARVITCAPTEAASLPGGQNRGFTITVKDPTTGSPFPSTAIDVAVATFIPPNVGATATVNGVSAVDRTAGSTITTMTTNSSGVITFVVSGRGAAVQPRAFLDDNSSDTLDTAEFRGDCGITTFES